VEAVFATRRITSQVTRFSYVVQHPLCDVAREFEDLLEDIPKENPYDALRAAVISRTGKSENKVLRDLFTTVELGDRSPSQMLRHMHSPMRPAVNPATKVLTPDLADPYAALIREYKDLFQPSAFPTQLHHEITHKSFTTGNPVSLCPRRLAPDKLATAKRSLSTCSIWALYLFLDITT
ncbi:hypothetical protein T265_12839, partial [Opisthorchis viverrini]